MKVIGYIRVSKQEQARDGISLEAQEERIRAYATFAQAEVVDIVHDHKSGKNLRRDGVVEAVERVIAGDADSLVVYALDRLARNTVDLLGIIDRLANAGKGFVSIREQLDASTPHGRFTLTILGAMAQMERELIASRTQEAMDKLRREGRPVGHVPYGFRKGDDGRLVEDVEEQRVIGYMNEMLRSEREPREIARRLNKMGLKGKRGGRWTTRDVVAAMKRSTTKGGLK